MRSFISLYLKYAKKHYTLVNLKWLIRAAKWW
jgi:hypothetical protein